MQEREAKLTVTCYRRDKTTVFCSSSVFFFCGTIAIYAPASENKSRQEGKKEGKKKKKEKKSA